MTNNDTSTLNGALQELGETMASNLQAKGVTASASDGLTTLAGKILTIPAGSCYHIEFSEDSYTAVGGSATLEIYLQENYQPKSGATVTVVGSDSSLYSGITNSNGIAEVTVTGITTTTTFTCSYSNVSDTCTVEVSQYLFYDECTSSDRLSEYGSYHQLKTTTATLVLSYDTSKNAYKLATNGVDGFADIPIPALDNKNNFYVEAEFFTTDSSTGGQPGLVVYPPADTTRNGVMFRDIANINRCGVLKFVNGSESGESGNSAQSSLVVYNNWIRIRLEVSGTSVKGIWLKSDGTEVYNYTYTVPYTSGAMRLGLAALPKSSSKPYYVRNIKAGLL